MKTLKLIGIGNCVGAILPKELLAKLHAGRVTRCMPSKYRTV